MAPTQAEPDRRRFDCFCVTLVFCTLPAFAQANESVVRKAASHGSFARFRDVPIGAVALGDGFWKTRFEVNAERSIPTFLGLLDEAGARDKLLGRKNKARANSDADLAKWVEAASLVLQSRNDESLRDMLESVVADILTSAEDGCYLDTRYGEKMPARLAQFRAGGDLYCLGHLIQAAAAYYRIAGDRRLLDVLVPCVDRVVDLFGPGKQPCWSGHPEIEMALVELYRVTGREKHLDFARYLLNEFDHRDAAGRADIDFAHYFAGVPFRSRRELTGHAVCAMYACCGAADYFLETGDRETWRALMALWEDLTRHKMYVTGGLGSRPSDEAIGEPYELLNERGYAETCAAIGNVMWNWRLLRATGEARFADLMELALYNAVLSGVSVEGETYFYWNPLLSKFYPNQKQEQDNAPDLLALKKATGISLNVRQRYYRTPCCIPNIQRTIASIPGYIYSISERGVWVHLYDSSRLNWHAETDEELALVQGTRYPWDNAVVITFEKVPSGPFSLFLRIPGWTTSAGVSINGGASSVTCNPGTYFEIRRSWKQGDRVEIEFAMPVRMVYANPRVRENAGRAAIQRGPLIYCLESVDHPDVSVFDIVLSSNPADTSDGFEVKFEQNLLGRIATITGDALSYGAPRAQENLYSFEQFPSPARTVKVKAIPYFAWANRGPSEMIVWVPWVAKR